MYVCRDPRDVAVSYFHHSKTLRSMYNYEGDFEQHVDLFLRDKLSFGPYWYHLKARRN